MAACGYGQALPMPAPDCGPVDACAPIAQPGYGAAQPIGYGAAPAPAPMPAVAMPNPFPDGDNCEDCGELVRTTKTVQVPCTRNTYHQYKIQVPRTVNEKIPRQVKYIDYEDRAKTVQYTVNRLETRYKDEQQCYTVPVTKCKTRMVNVVKKVPKTIYVDVTVQEPQQYNVVEQETRTKMVKIPFTVSVPETKTRVVTEKCPVEKCKTVYDDVCKTVYDTQIKTECRPVTKMVNKEIPVFHWRQTAPRPCGQPAPQPCPAPVPEPIPEPPCEPEPEPEMETERIKKTYVAPAKYDLNDDGVLDENERKLAERDGQLQVNEEIVGHSLRNSAGSAGRAQAEAQAAAASEAQRVAQEQGRIAAGREGPGNVSFEQAQAQAAAAGRAQALAQATGASQAQAEAAAAGAGMAAARPRPSGGYGGRSASPYGARSRSRSRSTGRTRTSRSRSTSRGRTTTRRTRSSRYGSSSRRPKY